MGYEAILPAGLVVLERGWLSSNNIVIRGRHGAAVVDVFQDHQTLFDDRVALVAFDVGDETDATGVVFIGWVVQTLRLHAILR